MATWPQQWDLFRTARIRVGTFRMRSFEPGFHDTGPVDDTQFVFPRQGVEITYAGRGTVIADPNVVMFYNKDQEYRRVALNPDGDRCEWFAIDRGIAEESVARFDPAVRGRPGRPFDLTHGPCEPRLYVLQRRITEALREGAAHVDPVRVEEATIALLDRAVEDAHRARGIRPVKQPRTRETTASHRALAERVRATLAARWDDRWTLGDLADCVDSSPYHLARVFRAQTGRTIHSYLTDLRLRHSLEPVAERGSDLTRVGLAAGFSSHSHFTREFRRRFGMTPSAFRDAVTKDRGRWSTILTA